MVKEIGMKATRNLEAVLSNSCAYRRTNCNIALTTDTCTCKLQVRLVTGKYDIIHLENKKDFIVHWQESTHGQSKQQQRFTIKIILFVL